MTTTPTPKIDQPSQPRPAPLPNQRQGGFQRGWLWLIAVVVLALAAYLIWGRSHQPADGAAGKPDQAGAATSGAGKGGGKGGKRGAFAGAGGPLPVGVAVAKSGDINIYIAGLGSVTPEATAVVKSRVDGQLMKLHFQEGQVVKAGALLAELDPRPYQVAVTQAEGQLARDTALLQAAQIDLKRYRTLLAQDSIASQQVDTQAALVKQYEGTVKSDQGSLDSARLQLTYSRVTAPIGGRLGLRQVDLGNVVHASDTNGIVIITQLQPITTVFSIPEDNIPSVMKQIQAGKKLPTDVWDRDQKNKLDSGYLLTIDNQVDSTTGTVKLKAESPNASYALFPSQFVNARMLLDTRKDAIVIPNAAIQRGAKGTFVYVVKPDHTVTIRQVTAGPTESESTAIEKGIAIGETVVVDGIDKLKEGAKIEPITRGGPAAAAAAAGAGTADAAGAHKGGHRHRQDASSSAAAASDTAAAPAANKSNSQ
ncbi:MdtA/MuxA family multidrug efflux RND transporter periplasmic adaptor subunit [Collimonas sp.]|jgi:multidrug efflux system membrane fusion protein|uniref:MdtA/MuxA family multidrug efflux RND transporter periplasmic adaptor subunit n=1 Tax=Collimonas sp. TaxID=1963772 RepID=UPI002C0A5F2D|nr:MdtA/MuxA family multidrug efflux RND transporter periplasmic adaptor subunit [Collimonas sp.]HWX03004.1 MdtA/MuxA family multidrug efflux RND transporter periplasmic adaptor subunit [Collimonas sp.]